MMQVAVLQQLEHHKLGQSTPMQNNLAIDMDLEDRLTPCVPKTRLEKPEYRQEVLS